VKSTNYEAHFSSLLPPRPKYSHQYPVSDRPQSWNVLCERRTRTVLQIHCSLLFTFIQTEDDAIWTHHYFCSLYSFRV